MRAVYRKLLAITFFVLLGVSTTWLGCSLGFRNLQPPRTMPPGIKVMTQDRVRGTVLYLWDVPIKVILSSNDPTVDVNVVFIDFEGNVVYRAIINGVRPEHYVNLNYSGFYFFTAYVNGTEMPEAHVSIQYLSEIEDISASNTYKKIVSETLFLFGLTALVGSIYGVVVLRDRGKKAK